MILFRPVGKAEYDLIAESDFTAYPPRLPEQPVFYPVLNEKYAKEIAEKWNRRYPDSQYTGYVTTFKIEDAYISQFPVRTVGASYHQEFWIPAEELDNFNRHIIGKIEIIYYTALPFVGAADMNIREIHENKKQFLPLLLLADEQEDMIDHYLERGTMYVLEDGGVKAECVVTDEGGGIMELKNLAVQPEAQGKGYGRAMIDFLVRTYAGRYALLQVGTGDSPLTVPFYEKCGFTRSHCIPNFFTDHYDHPIYEAGVQLVDMVYLQRNL